MQLALGQGLGAQMADRLVPGRADHLEECLAARVFDEDDLSQPPSPKSGCAGAPRKTIRRHSKAQAPRSSLIPAKVVSELVAQGLLDLPGKQVTVVSEVALERVTVDDDPILIVFSRDTVSEVLAVCVNLIAEIGYDDRDTRQYLLEFNRKPVDRIDDQRLELV